MKPDDMRIPDSFEIAKEHGIEVAFGESALRDAHPNTAQIFLTSVTGKNLEVVGESLGGSRINIAQIDGISTNFSGDYPTLVVHNMDQPGHVAEVTSMLAHKSVNIAAMQLYRAGRGGNSVMVLECDQEVPEEGINWLRHAERCCQGDLSWLGIIIMQNLISIIIGGKNGGFMAEYHSISDLVKLSINNKQELWQVVLTGQAHDKLMSERDVFAQMKKDVSGYEERR